MAALIWARGSYMELRFHVLPLVNSMEQTWIFSVSSLQIFRMTKLISTLKYKWFDSLNFGALAWSYRMKAKHQMLFDHLQCGTGTLIAAHWKPVIFCGARLSVVFWHITFGMFRSTGQLEAIKICASLPLFSLPV